MSLLRCMKLDVSACKFLDEIVKGGGLLILGLTTALVENAYLDAWIDALECLAGLGGGQHALAAQHDDDRHLEASERLVDIHGQVVGEQRSLSVARIGLVRTGVDVLNQFVGDEARIVVALHIIITTNGLARAKHVVDELTDDRHAQHKARGSAQRSRHGLLQDRWWRRQQDQTLEELWMTEGVGDNIGAGQAVRNDSSGLTDNLADKVTDQVNIGFRRIVDGRTIREAEAEQVDGVDTKLLCQTIDVLTPLVGRGTGAEAMHQQQGFGIACPLNLIEHIAVFPGIAALFTGQGGIQFARHRLCDFIINSHRAERAAKNQPGCYNVFYLHVNHSY